MTQRKKMLTLNILEILKKHTDSEHTLSQAQILELLRREYEMTVERKAVKRALADLYDGDYGVECSETERITKSGEAEVVQSDWYISHDFSDAELRLIIDSLLFSKHIPKNHCKALINKLCTLSNKYFTKRTAHITNLPEDMPQCPELFLTVEVLDEAISKKSKVTFEYCDRGTDKKLHPRLTHDGAPRIYTVNPYQMAATNGRYYLIANIDKFDGIIHFRIDRIRGIKITDTPAKPVRDVKGMEDGLSLNRHMAENIYMFGGKSGTVTMRAKKYIVGDIIDWFGTDVRFSDESDDEVTATVYVSFEAMKYWALQYGAHVTVTAPDFLVKDIGTVAADIARRYGM